MTDFQGTTEALISELRLVQASLKDLQSRRPKKSLLALDQYIDRVEALMRREDDLLDELLDRGWEPHGNPKSN